MMSSKKGNNMIRSSVVSGRELDGFSLARGKKRRLGPSELMRRFLDGKEEYQGSTLRVNA